MNRFNNKIFLLLAIVTNAYGITPDTPYNEPYRIQYSIAAMLALRNLRGNSQEIRVAEVSNDTSNAARVSSSNSSTSSS